MGPTAASDAAVAAAEEVTREQAFVEPREGSRWYFPRSSFLYPGSRCKARLVSSSLVMFALCFCLQPRWSWDPISPQLQPPNKRLQGRKRLYQAKSLPRLVIFSPSKATFHKAQRLPGLSRKCCLASPEPQPQPPPPAQPIKLLDLNIRELRIDLSLIHSERAISLCVFAVV